MHSTKSLPILLYKHGESVQAIIVFYDRMLDRTKLDNMRLPGSPVYDDMQLYNCRVVNVFTRKKPALINYEDLAFNCMWVFDYEDYKQLSSDRKGCFLFPHNQYLYEYKIKNFVNKSLVDTVQQRAGVVLPTGWGKTYLMARIIFDHPDRKALIVCPTKLIRDQFKAILSPFKDTVTIMTYQALLMKHLKDQDEEEISEECLQNVELALFDEIHHSLGEEYRKAVSHFMNYYNPKIAIGFTATPMGGKSLSVNSIEHHFNKNVLAQVSFNDAWQYDLLPTPSVICPTKKRLIEEHDYSPISKSDNVLANHINTPNIQLSDEALSEMVTCLQSGQIKHVLYFLKEWDKYGDAEHLMQRALKKAGYNEEQYRFWTLKGDEDSDREQQATKKSYEQEPEDGVAIHVLFGAVMIKEGYHPKCRVDMAIIGYSINSENMIIQMIGRTQFVQSGLVNKREPYHPVIVDFANTTAIFRQQAEYIDLSGKAPVVYNHSGDRGGRAKRGPIMLISDAKVLTGEEALINMNKQRKFDWDIFKDSLEEFFANTGSVPGECTGYIDLYGRHTEKNRLFFDYYSRILLHADDEYHKQLVDWLKRKKQGDSLQWIEYTFPDKQRIESLFDFYSISDNLVRRVEFYDQHIQQYEPTLGVSMVEDIQSFIDKLGSLIHQKVLPLFRDRYGVAPSPAMAKSDHRLTQLCRCCQFIATVDAHYYMGSTNQNEFELVDHGLATDWHRVLWTIEQGNRVNEAMGQFLDHFTLFATNEQLGKKRLAFLHGLGINFESPEAANDELSLLARIVNQFLQSEDRSDNYYYTLRAVYAKLFKQTTNVPLFIMLMGNLLMEKRGEYIRVLGCIVQDRIGYFNCFGGSGAEANSANAKELCTQFYEMMERVFDTSKQRLMTSVLKEEVAFMLRKDPEATEVDRFVKRLKVRDR